MPTEYKLIGADGREYPGTLEEMREWARDGRLGSESLVWCSEEGRWIRASLRPELQWDLPKPVEPPPILSEPEPLPPAAGLIPRLAAYLFDWLLLQMVLVPLVLLPWSERIAALGEKVQAQMALMSTMPADADPTPLMLLTLQMFGVLAAAYLPISLVYFVGCNARFGGTPGKFIVGLRVVDEAGNPIGFRQAFRRYSAEGICALTLGLGYVMIAFSPTHQGLHDVMAKTRVVFHRPERA